MTQYVQNYKRHEVDQGYSEKFFENSARVSLPDTVCCMIFEEICFSICVFNCFLARFFLHDQKLRQKFKYLDNEKRF